MSSPKTLPAGDSAPAPASAPARTALALTVIMAGVLMAAVDTTIVALALPEIQTALLPAVRARAGSR